MKRRKVNIQIHFIIFGCAFVNKWESTQSPFELYDGKRLVLSDDFSLLVKAAHLTDIFIYLNEFNLSLQGAAGSYKMY